jgi:lactoylglutathione lyase
MMRRAVPLLAWSAVSCSGLHVAARAPHVAARAPFIRRAVFLSTSRGFNPDKYFTMERPVETRDYIMQQTMIRVKDPEVSLKFYCEVLGFNLVMYRDFPQYEFTVFFVAQVDPALIPKNPEDQWRFCMQTPGCIELTHNYGTEAVPGRVYNTGNSDMTGSQDGQKVKGGFGHLGITVPDVCKWSACARFVWHLLRVSKADTSLVRLASFRQTRRANASRHSGASSPNRPTLVA